jgi:hypothetical protein
MNAFDSFSVSCQTVCERFQESAICERCEEIRDDAVLLFFSFLSVLKYQKQFLQLIIREIYLDLNTVINLHGYFNLYP